MLSEGAESQILAVSLEESHQADVAYPVPNLQPEIMNYGSQI